MQCRRGTAVDADITVGAVESEMTAPEVRRMVWQQTGVDGEETRTAVARWSGYAGELHVSRLHYAQPGLGQHVLTCSVFKKNNVFNGRTLFPTDLHLQLAALVSCLLQCARVISRPKI